LAPVFREAGVSPRVGRLGVGLSNEFSRKVVIEPWPEGGVALKVHAEPDERRALARRFDLLELTALEAEGRLERDAASGEIRFHGSLAADLEQECVVTLEPVPARIRRPVERRYLRAEGRAPHGPVAEFQVPEDGEDEEEVELVYGRTIDLGEVLAEELALALDTYPRAADADALVAGELAPYIGGGTAEPAEQPFAALRQLKQNRAR
jgi:uncharacterized metal-binding protein YceD (DUF177 family)